MQNKKLLTLTALIGAGFLQTALADEEFLDDRWYVSPFASYLHPGGDRNAVDGWGGGMGFGKIIDKHFNVEVRGFYQDMGASKGLWSVTGGTADLQYYFFRDKFSPYAVIAAGGLNSCLSAKCAGSIIGEAGLGFSYELNDNFLIRSDVRYRYNNDLNANLQPGTNEFHDMVINLGFVIPFGEKPKPVLAKAEPPMAAPAPVRVDCSTQDSDGDGVNNCLDKCPNTVKGSKVDAMGCPLKLILKGNHFKVDSAELTTEARTTLDEVADSLMAYPEKNSIEIKGYTSSEGGDAHNMRLSQNRANSVANYLKSKGVTNKLHAKGYGKADPVADNKTEAGRSENRRVELQWLPSN